MEKPKLAIKQLLFVILIFLGLYVYGPKQTNMFSVTGKTMGTYYVIKSDSQDIKKFASAIDNILINFNQIFSTYINESEISRWNSKLTTSPQSVSESLYSLAGQAQTYCNLSKGYYDVSIQGLVNVWGFGPQKITSPPKQKDIDQLLTSVGCDKFELLEGYQLRKKHADVQLDFSSIAKGLAVDKVYQFLISKGLANFIVEIGGELRVSGKPSESRKYYKLGINRPDENSSATDIAEILLLEDGQALATSGNYRNMIENDGFKWAHILSPITGKPQKNDVISASIVGSNCAQADAIATMAMSLGSAEAVKILDQMKLEYLLILREASDGKPVILRSKNLKWLSYDKENS